MKSYFLILLSITLLTSCEMWDPYAPIDLENTIDLTAEDNQDLLANGVDTRLFTVHFKDEVSPGHDVSLILTNGSFRSLDPDTQNLLVDSVLTLSPPYKTTSFLVQSSIRPDDSVLLIASLGGFSTKMNLQFLPSRPQDIFFAVPTQRVNKGENANIELSLEAPEAGSVSDFLNVRLSTVKIEPDSTRISFPEIVKTQSEKAIIPISNLDDLEKEVILKAEIENHLGAIISREIKIVFE